MSELRQNQEQKLKLSIKQVLHAKLLQLNAQLLEQRILKEISDNPVLELAEDQELEESEIQEDEDSLSQDEISEIDDKRYDCSKSEKELTKSFYGTQD